MAFPSADHYVWPSAGGSDDGTSWEDAWVSLQSAFDNVSAGDVVYCRGTETLSAKLDIDTTDGTAANPIIFIGCDSSGTPGDDVFTVDGDSTAQHCIDDSSKDYYHFYYFRFTGATSSCVDHGNSSHYGWRYDHCLFDDAGARGHNAYSSYYGLHLHCVYRDNTDAGIYWPGVNNWHAFCLAEGNGKYGFFGGTRSSYYGCLSYENTYEGFLTGYGGSFFFNCVAADNSQDGIEISSNYNLILGCRICGNTLYGIYSDTSDPRNYEDYNVFEANSSGDYYQMTTENEHPSNSDYSPADDGFVDSANDDYNVKSGAEIRSTAILLNWDE